MHAANKQHSTRTKAMVAYDAVCTAPAAPLGDMCYSEINSSNGSNFPIIHPASVVHHILQ
jgi:hypothetical protein